MRDRGFNFAATNRADTVTVKVQLHWDHGVSEDELTETLTAAYAEAFQRAASAHSPT